MRRVLPVLALLAAAGLLAQRFRDRLPGGRGGRHAVGSPPGISPLPPSSPMEIATEWELQHPH